MAVKIDIDHLAKLANLPLTDTEKKKFEKQLDQILDYFSQLNEVNTDKMEPIGHITGLENIIRDDEAAPSLFQEDALKNAKSTHNGFFKVPAIINDKP